MAQLGADAAGAAAGGGAGLAAAGFAGAVFFAGAVLALAFLADFFGVAALDFLAGLFADFLAFFADFLADFLVDFLVDFLADFFFAVRSFLLFLAFLPFFFLPLAIVVLLLPLSRVYRALQVVRRRVRP